ncbi:MAG: carbohydrate ABC transporter permease [Verrucomicrobia bacterium]|nr:carbohydrate ABC transporter permease [Verrucomicrobiota bacterium]MBU1734581.1 carbohydrate ABC transporter permease [Verrucomicrobiota bacterium]MBU1856234.1 carbohydrate ABC transporter permease [Verrucomicrobiota bacterium]
MSAKSGMKSKSMFAEMSRHTLILFVLLFAFFPLYMMLQISLKDNAQFTNNLWLPMAPFHWANWQVGWLAIRDFIANTVVVSVFSTVLTLAFATITAYVFARYKFFGSEFLFFLLLGVMMMVGVASLVPLFTLLRDLQLLNTLTALVILSVSGGQVMCVYVLKNFIEDIPKDLFDAASIDGAGDFGSIWNVVLPMSGAILSTLGILRFIGTWNDFIMPMLVMRDQKLYTLGIGLMSLSSGYDRQWGPLMAAYCIASIPLVLIFVFTMRLFVKGLSSGAVKG